MSAAAVAAAAAAVAARRARASVAHCHRHSCHALTSRVTIAPTTAHPTERRGRHEAQRPTPHPRCPQGPRPSRDRCLQNSRTPALTDGPTGARYRTPRRQFPRGKAGRNYSERPGKRLPRAGHPQWKGEAPRRTTVQPRRIQVLNASALGPPGLIAGCRFPPS